MGQHRGMWVHLGNNDGTPLGSEREDEDILSQIADVAKKYPIKKRALFALSMFLMLSLGTIGWRFEPAKVIATCAAVIACFFDRNGKWFWFFVGIALGDLLLYLF